MKFLYVDRDHWLSNCVQAPCFNVIDKGMYLLNEIITQNEPLFVTCKLPEDSKATRQYIEDLDFVFVNKQLTFRGVINELYLGKSSEQFQFINEESQDFFSSLSCFANLFVHDRFNVDTRLPCEWSTKIKAHWISAPDSGKEVIIALNGSDIAGFIMYQNFLDFVAIDLVAVAPEYRGRKVGLQLLSNLQLKVRNNQMIVVGTQDSNFAAIKLYLEAGLKVINRKVVYHFYREG